MFPAREEWIKDPAAVPSVHDLRSIGKVINDYQYLVAPFMAFIFVIFNYGRLI